MIYITGDKHRDFKDIYDFCFKNNLSKEDVMIILGDAGINYYLDMRDDFLKYQLQKLPLTFFMIHGNHEERPENIKTYETKFFHEGLVYYERNYPNLLFARDGEIYDFNHQKVLVIGGAYSIDKDYRILNGYQWFKDEQPSEEIKKRVLNVLEKNNYQVDIILSHTCPYKYEPREVFIQGIDEDNVDKTTEMFLDEIEAKANYKKWYCGHFHTDKKIDKIEFMMNNIKKMNTNTKEKIKVYK